MTVSINTLSGARATPPAAVPTNVRETFKPLAQALQAGDLAAAKSAYADILKHPPEGATFQPGSPFAEVGKALLHGDVDAAKGAFVAMVKGALTPPPVVTLPPTPVPVSSTTGGVAGGLLNTVA